MLDIMVLLRQMPPALAQGLIWGIMAIGVFITYKLLNFADLSVDGSITLGGAVAVMLTLNGWPPQVTLIISFITGALAGLVTGLLHTVLGIPDILAGILTQISLYSINLNIMGRANQAVSVDKYDLVVSLRYIEMCILTLLIFTVVIIAILYWFFGTEEGVAIRATGCNENMAKAQSINTRISKIIALSLSNALVGLAGGLLAMYQGNADVNMGRGAIVIGLAAVIIGEVLGNAILGKRMNFVAKLSFAAIGAIIYYIVISFVLWLGLPSENLKLFSAIVVAIFLAVPYLTGSYRNSFGRAAKRAEAAAGGTDVKD